VVKLFLAIKSCHKNAELERAQRETFLLRSPVEYRFFRGRGSDSGPNVVVLDVDDSYWSLPFKTQAICRWVVLEDYDYAFFADTDTYIHVDRLQRAGFEDHDYMGYFSYDPGPGAYASGGSGYFLSKRAMKLVGESTSLELDYRHPERQEEISYRGEDLQVGWIMRDAGIACHKDERFRLRTPGPSPDNDLITLHDVISPLKSASAMRAYHGEWFGGENGS